MSWLLISWLYLWGIGPVYLSMDGEKQEALIYKKTVLFLSFLWPIIVPIIGAMAFRKIWRKYYGQAH